MTKKSNTSEDKRIEEEKKSLKQAFNTIPEEKQSIADKLIDRLAFMTITLQNLEEEIKSEGATYLMKNGSQEMIVENPAQKSYNTMINRFTATFDKLIGLLPKDKEDTKIPEDNGFTKFLEARS